MGLMLAFAFGYAVGAKAGEKGYQDVVDAARSVGQSEEFRGLLAALRSHASATLQELSVLVAEQPDEPILLGKVLDRVNGLIARTGVRFPAS